MFNCLYCRCSSLLGHGVSAVVGADIFECLPVLAVDALIDGVVEQHILFVVLHVGHIALVVVHHVADRLLRGLEGAQPHIGEHGAAEGAVLVGLRLAHGQPRDVRDDAADAVGDGAAARDHDALDVGARSLLYAAESLVKPEADAFYYRAVEMRAGVDVREADHRAFRPRDLDLRRPIGLQHQALIADGGDVQEFVEELFGRAAEFRCSCAFLFAELFLEPGHHPAAAEDLHLGVIQPFDDGGVGGHERLRLDIFLCGDLDGRGSAHADGRLVRPEHAGAEGLAALVRAACDDGQARFQPRLRRCLRGDVSDEGSGVHKVHHLVRSRVREIVVDDLLGLPLLVFVVEGEMPDLRRDAVHQPPRQTEIDVSRKLDDLFGVVPHLGLVLVHPVHLGHFADAAERLPHLDRFEHDLLREGDDLFNAGAFALVQPYEEGAQHLFVLVHESDGVADGGHTHGDDAVKAQWIFLFQAVDGFHHIVPIGLGILFRPAAVQRKIGRKRHFCLADLHAAVVVNDGADALCAEVDGKHVIVAHNISLNERKLLLSIHRAENCVNRQHRTPVV